MNMMVNQCLSCALYTAVRFINDQACPFLNMEYKTRQSVLYSGWIMFYSSFFTYNWNKFALLILFFFLYIHMFRVIRIPALLWRTLSFLIQKGNVLQPSTIQMIGLPMLQRKLLRRPSLPRPRKQMPGLKVLYEIKCIYYNYWNSRVLVYIFQIISIVNRSYVTHYRGLLFV